MENENLRCDLSNKKTDQKNLIGKYFKKSSKVWCPERTDKKKCSRRVNLLVRLDFTSKSREFKIEHSNCLWEWPILFERRRNKKELAKTYGCASGSAFYVLLIFLILWLGSYIYCLSHPFCILPSHYFRASFVFILSFVLHHFLLFLLEYICYGPNETT